MASFRGARIVELTARIGEAGTARRITVNLAGEVTDELRNNAVRHGVSESSIVEVALRQLFRRVASANLGAFLREQGACLRRKGA